MQKYSLTRICLGLLFSISVLSSWPGSLHAQPVRLGLEAGVSQISADFDEPQRGWHEPNIKKPSMP